jgi:hypothetical protein
LRNFDFESTPSARMMRLRRRHNVALGGGISVFRVAKLIAASSKPDRSAARLLAARFCFVLDSG